MAIFKTLWGWFSGSAIGKYLIEGILLIAAAGGLYAKIRLDGEHAQAAKDTQSTLKDVETANSIQNDVARMPAREAAQELAASKWNKP